MLLKSSIFLGWLLLSGSAIGCFYLVGAGLIVRRFAARHASAGDSAGVTMLKPLCGEDPGLYDNLESFCRQAYPNWQIVFGVQDPGDPAIAVVRRLMAEHPQADIALIVDSRRHGVNLKIANVLNMLPAARHDILVISDADMRVSPSYLAEVTAPLRDRDIGLVTCLYRGVSAGGLWSRLGASHIDHGFLPQAAVAEALKAGAGCFGATLALRRDTLEAIGGFAVIADRLADDHALGGAVHRLGRRVVLSPHIVDNIIYEPGLAALFRHELRWARTIRLLAPGGYLGSVVTHPLVLAVLALPLVKPPLIALIMVGIALACRCAMVRVIDHALRLPATPLWLVPARDLLSFAVFVASFFTRTVAWRDRRFRIGPDGRLVLDGDRPA